MGMVPIRKHKSFLQNSLNQLLLVFNISKRETLYNGICTDIEGYILILNRRGF